MKIKAVFLIVTVCIALLLLFSAQPFAKAAEAADDP